MSETSLTTHRNAPGLSRSGVDVIDYAKLRDTAVFRFNSGTLTATEAFSASYNFNFGVARLTVGSHYDRLCCIHLTVAGGTPGAVPAWTSGEMILRLYGDDTLIHEETIDFSDLTSANGTNAPNGAATGLGANEFTFEKPLDLDIGGYSTFAVSTHAPAPAVIGGGQTIVNTVFVAERLP